MEVQVLLAHPRYSELAQTTYKTYYFVYFNIVNILKHASHSCGHLDFILLLLMSLICIERAGSITRKCMQSTGVYLRVMSTHIRAGVGAVCVVLFLAVPILYRISWVNSTFTSQITYSILPAPSSITNLI